jgi:PAS domain S-box-containing protein
MAFLRSTLIPLIAAALGILTTVIAGRLLYDSEQTAVQTEFERRSQAIANMIGLQVRINEDILHGLRSLFHYSDDVSRAEFAGAAGDLMRNEDLLALEWAARVPGGQRAAVEAAVRAEGYPDFEFADRGQGPALQRAPDRAEHFPIIYIHPYAANKGSLGFDLVSALTWPALQRAAGENAMVASGRIPLITDGRNRDWGVLLELPVYRLPVPEAPEKRREQLRGYVIGVCRPADLIEVSLAKLPPEGVDLLVVDPQAAAGNELLHWHPSRRRAAPIAAPSVAEMTQSQVRLMIPLPIAGRHWNLHFRPTTEWLALRHNYHWLLVLLGGGAGSLLLGFYLRGTLRRTGIIEQQVAARTAELRASEARLQAILDHSPALIFVKDLAGRYTIFNRPFAELCRRPPDAIKGHTDHEVFPAAWAREYVAHDRQVLAAGRPMEFEETAELDGKILTKIVQKFPLVDAEGRAYALCGIATDITERKQAEAELLESRRQLGNLISQLPGAAFRCLFDENLTALFASEGMQPLTGYPAGDFTSGLVHMPSLTVPEDRPVVRAAVASAIEERRNFEVEYRITHREGHVKWLLVRGRPIHDEAGALRFLEGLAIDVTALKRAELEKLALERNLLETQKLESLGVMAGGIAHDFNNILTAVLGNASLARLALKPGDTGQDHLEQIENASRRAADLCSQMLAYAGKGRISVGPIDLSNLVRDTVSMLEVSVGKKCRLVLDLAGALPPVLGDAAQLGQIVMNLVINGADAIGDRPGGRITVTTFAREADAALFGTALHKPALRPGLYVGLEVRDNGCGIAPATMSRIFEPFFTTKFSGRGLGLSAVIGIVQSHQGALFVESEPGVGSAFRLLLPTSTATPAAPPEIAPAAVSQPLRGTVLVVDDEEAVRNLVGTVLRRQGITAVLAADGREALALFRQQRDTIDLILLDLTMPGLSGEEVLRQLQQLGARPKIVVMSGYSEEDIMQRCAELGVAGFMRKPFELQTILDKVSAYLS